MAVFEGLRAIEANRKSPSAGSDPVVACRLAGSGIVNRTIAELDQNSTIESSRALRIRNVQIQMMQRAACRHRFTSTRRKWRKTWLATILERPPTCARRLINGAKQFCSHQTDGSFP